MNTADDRTARLNEILTDRTSGSASLAIRSADFIASIAGETTGAGQAVSRDEILSTCASLTKAHPAMAAVWNLAHNITRVASGAGSEREQRERVLQECHDFAARLKTSEQNIAGHARALIRPQGMIAAHSYSNTVLAALRSGIESKVEFRLLCTESRPGNEGVAFARDAGAEGIPVTLVTDGAIAAELQSASAVFLGADAVGLGGFVNKVGTWALALAAREYAIPVYVLCGTEKFVPPSFPLRHREASDPTEVLSSPPPLVSPLNHYFELTPLSLVTKFVYERGFLLPAELTLLLEEIAATGG